MAQENTWTIVLFLDDNAVAAVPTIWIQGDYCHWPTFALPRLTNAIKKCEPLNTCWPSHKIRIFRNSTFHDYAKARSKAQLAENCSDLASEVESTSNKPKRKRIERVLSSSDESVNSESLLPTPPKMLKQRVTTISDDRSLPRSLYLTSGEENTNKLDLNSNQNISITNEIYNTNTNQNTSNETIVNSNLVCSNIHCIERDKQLRTIIDQNHMLRGIATDILREVKTIREEHIVKPSSRLSDVSIFIKYQPDLHFPLSSEEDVLKFENLMENEDNFLQAVNELANFGGSNNYNFVKRALMALLSNGQAMKYSFWGRKGKKPFKEMSLAKIVISAAEKAQLAKSRKETEYSIQSWLKRAAERTKSQTKKL